MDDEYVMQTTLNGGLKIGHNWSLFDVLDNSKWREKVFPGDGKFSFGFLQHWC